MNVCLEMFKITNSNNLMLIATQLTYTLYADVLYLIYEILFHIVEVSKDHDIWNTVQLSPLGKFVLY